MSDIDGLLQRWRDDVLQPDERDRLLELLRQEAVRSEAVDALRFDGALREALALDSANARAPEIGADTRRLERQRPRRGLWTPRTWLAAAACLCALIGGAVWSHSAPGAWARIAASESAQMIRAGHPAAASVGDVLHPGDAVIGPATIVFGDGTRMILAAATEAICEDASGAKRITLERGRLDAEVARQPAGAVLSVETRDARATVIGTRFTIAVVDGRTRLSVAEGTVSFHDRARRSDTLVHAGSEASTDVPAPAGPAPTRMIVMTWNVKYAERGSIEKQVRVMADSGADVVSLQQVLDRDRDAYDAELERVTGHTWYVSDPGPAAPPIYSRIPPIDSECRWIGRNSWGTAGRGATRMKIMIGGVAVNVFNTHLDISKPPETGPGFRTENVDLLMAWMQELPDPLVLAADLNCESGSPWITRLESRFVDTWREANGDAPGPRTAMDGIWRADWVMRSRADTSLRTLRAWMIDTDLSENDPVLAEFTCDPP
ncbi:MAG: FecR domain-containing protein [Planctomycetes bacterium]|nr:FecR domain-containing protein [Planctomycetota bacterium]